MPEFDLSQYIDRSGDRALAICAECGSPIYEGEPAYHGDRVGFVHALQSTCEFQKWFQSEQSRVLSQIEASYNEG